jgi:hypothetical protein
MPRAKKTKSVEELDSKIDEALVEEHPPVDNEHVEEGSERFKEEFVVINSDGGEVRTFTLEIHGERAGELAQEFAATNGYSVQA